MVSSPVVKGKKTKGQTNNNIKGKTHKETLNIMFVEITTNTNTKALVRKEDIVGIKELPLETEKLYDELGNLVSETPKDKSFQVFVKNEGSRLVLMVDEIEYQRLVAELIK